MTIPQARLVSWDDLRNVGRVSPGDVVYVAHGVRRAALRAHRAPTRIAGADWMNRQLGKPKKGADMTQVSSLPLEWVPGVTVIMGASSTRAANALAAGDAVADDWRALPILRSWCVDGVVLSNDEPGVMQGSGSHDAQLFNIAIQGNATVNNGYIDVYGNGLIDPKQYPVADVYGKMQYDFARRSDPYYNSYPMQMFDRKIRTLVNVYVGLVATKRALNPAVRAELLARARRAGAPGTGGPRRRPDGTHLLHV